MAFTIPYALTNDITDGIITPFVTSTHANLAKWRTECDNEVKSVCETKGVSIDEFEASSTSAHSKVQEFWRAYFCKIVCRDTIGTNNVETAADEKYRIKYDMYRDVSDALRNQLTPEVFRNTVSSSNPLGSGRVGGGLIWRSEG